MTGDLSDDISQLFCVAHIDVVIVQGADVGPSRKFLGCSKLFVGMEEPVEAVDCSWASRRISICVQSVNLNVRKKLQTICTGFGHCLSQSQSKASSSSSDDIYPAAKAEVWVDFMVL